MLLERVFICSYSFIHFERTKYWSVSIFSWNLGYISISLYQATECIISFTVCLIFLHIIINCISWDHCTLDKEWLCIKFTYQVTLLHTSLIAHHYRNQDDQFAFFFKFSCLFSFVCVFVVVFFSLDITIQSKGSCAAT